VFVVLFFTLSKSKLPGYILPAVPALALLLVLSCRNLAIEHRKSFGASIAAFALLFWVAAHVAPRLLPHADTPSHRVLLVLSFVFGMFSMANTILAAAFLVSRSRWELNFMAWICVVPVLFAFLGADEPIPGLASLSSKELARQLLSQHVPPERIFVYHGMGRSLRYGLNFYLQREVRDWDQNLDADAFVLSGSFNCERLHKEGFDCVDILLGPTTPRWFVSHITSRNSAGRLHESRQPH